MKHSRPVNLDLTSLKFPVMAIVSILHRISGLVLFLLFPCLLYIAHLSFHSESGFHEAGKLMSHPLSRGLLWIFMAALVYHFFAGIRHIVMDLGVGDGLPVGRRTAWLILALALVFIILVGIWLW